MQRDGGESKRGILHVCVHDAASNPRSRRKQGFSFPLVLQASHKAPHSMTHVLDRRCTICEHNTKPAQEAQQATVRCERRMLVPIAAPCVWMIVTHPERGQFLLAHAGCRRRVTGEDGLVETILSLRGAM